MPSASKEGTTSPGLRYTGGVGVGVGDPEGGAGREVVDPAGDAADQSQRQQSLRECSRIDVLPEFWLLRHAPSLARACCPGDARATHRPLAALKAEGMVAGAAARHKGGSADCSAEGWRIWPMRLRPARAYIQ